ncbi:CDF family zinc transporter ZitB [Atlantibacter subterraneus]|uniref:Zinc transporter ZitB n=2 Tax=Atlantibacter subterraneus TaxID=255519 RepID=A0A427V9Q1_9ENTR|nr:CDF family zinc transporter ZitB [Atlantibacter subterranea]MDZ5664284.1 CDF family zinc transporter ZitB [Atlantibacter hermannii]QFH72235.1 CDF family zinc transporter ZitB [Enterobacter sp. E76]MDA3134061.1 CDF family zinc transporter ZitB [Atlantibacter subterranea]MDV7021618.1 CDF family zinc transporter ZitB [Atlantibacter subterranea]MDW2741549.1 CDF family zinc transporter ZitB [Atlantibacter subterranea]
MAHSHSHTPASDSNSNSKRLLAAFVVTATFMVLEVIGGLISGSLALLADAGHMLTDAAALLFAFLAVYFARRPPNNQQTFGWLRLTTLAAFINAIALVLITVLIVYEAFVRFYHPQPIAGKTMMVIAVAGLFANILAFWILHRGSEEKNMNVRAAALHVLGDLLGSVGAIIAALVILWTGWTPVDPILSVLVSCLVLRSAWRLLKESVNELLEGAPKALDIAALKRNLSRSIPEVRDVHHVHIWLVGEKPVMTLHVQVIPPHDHDALLGRIHHFLEHEYHVEHATVQMEYQPCSGPDCHLYQSTPDAHHHHHH